MQMTIVSASNERVRQQYLEAMGVSSFVPRFLLSAAKAPVRCRLPLALAEQKATPQPALPAQAPVPDAPSVLSAAPASGNLNVVVNQTRATAKSLVEPSRLNPDLSAGRYAEKILQNLEGVSQDQRPAAFSLSAWRASQAIYCIDSRRPGDALPTARLLQNILFSIGAGENNLPAAEILNWPLVPTNPDKSWHAARNMLRGFFDAKILASSPVNYFFLFGRSAISAFTQINEDEVDAHLFTRYEQKILQADAILLPSLAEILYHPEYKPRVWQLIKTIRPS